MSDALIDIEVAWALPDDQTIIALRVAPGCTAGEAVAMAAEQIPEGLSADDVGVFGRRVPAHHVLHSGDRVELYRPLTADPKDIRRELARLARETPAGAAGS